MRSRDIVFLRGTIGLCCLLLAASVAVQLIALIEWQIMQLALAIYSRTGHMVYRPSWLMTSNSWLEGKGETVIVLLMAAFRILCVAPLSLAQTALRRLDVTPTLWTRLTPLGMLFPFAEAVLPWIGLNAARTTIAAIETPGRRRILDGTTCVLALVFDAKLVVDAIVHSRLDNVILLKAERLRLHEVELLSSIVLLAVFWFYWRGYGRAFARALQVHRTATVEAAF